MNRQPDHTEDALRAAFSVMVEDTPPAPEWEDFLSRDPLRSQPTPTPRRGFVTALAAAGLILVLVGAVAISVLVLGSDEEVIDPAPTSTLLQSPLSGGSWEAVDTLDLYTLNFKDLQEPWHAVYDSESDLVVSLRGFNNPTSTFNTNLAEWAEVATTQYPVTMQEIGTPVYDPIADRVIVFNDQGSTVSFHTDWGYWTNLAPAAGPSGRRGQGMVNDTESEIVVMFGGGTPDPGGAFIDEVLGDTWTYDAAGNLWIEQAPTVAPSPRLWPGMVYDSESDRVVLFGGAEGLAWQVDPNSGVPHEPEIAPTGLGETYGDTWVYDTNTDTWTEMYPPVSPAARTWAAMWYDPTEDLVFLFGGSSQVDYWPLPSPVMFGGEELWAYDLEANVWTLYAVDSPDPGYLVGAAAAFDVESEAAVVFGGGRYDPETKNKGFNTQTWLYRHVE